MNVKPVLICLIPYAALFAPNAFASLSTVDVSSQYSTLPIDSDDDSASSLPLSAEAHALAGSKPDNYAQADAAIHFDTASPIPRCLISSVTEGFIAGSSLVSVHAQSYAFSTADWLVSSDTLPAGTPVWVWLDIRFDGRLYSEGSAFVSSAETSILLNDTEIYAGSASFANPDLTADGSWAGNLEQSGDNAYDLLAPATPTFYTAVGETINLTFWLQTEIGCTNAIEGGARADLSGTGYYSFLAAYNLNIPPRPLDVDFVLIPEPASILLLAAGLLRLRRGF